jgi:hypothetical protein
MRFETASLLHLSTVAAQRNSNQPWVKFQSAGWVNIQSAPTPHHHELGGEAGVRSNFTLNPWFSASGHPRREVRIATVDLSLLNTVPEQLRNIVHFACEEETYAL